jgi:hypothetical protein
MSHTLQAAPEMHMRAVQGALFANTIALWVAYSAGHFAWVIILLAAAFATHHLVHKLLDTEPARAGRNAKLLTAMYGALAVVALGTQLSNLFVLNGLAAACTFYLYRANHVPA